MVVEISPLLLFYNLFTDPLSREECLTVPLQRVLVAALVTAAPALHPGKESLQKDSRHLCWGNLVLSSDHLVKQDV